MAYVQPTLLSMGGSDSFPLTMPVSGGYAIQNPGQNYVTFVFDDGRIAYYDFDGHLLREITGT